MAVIKTQGTNVFVFDGTAVTQLTCITGIDLGSDSVNRIENTCLEERISKGYVSGLADPAEASLMFNLDPENASHLKLLTYAQTNKEGLQFYIGASDGTDPVTASGAVVTVPTTRSFWTFTGSVSAPTPSFEADALVGYTVTLQREGAVTFVPKTP